VAKGGCGRGFGRAWGGSRARSGVGRGGGGEIDVSVGLSRS